MEKKTIMLVCAAGMSTSLLVNKMKKSAQEEGYEVDIFAVSAQEADINLEEKTIDALLLGPQVKFMEKQFQEKVSGSNTKLGVINMQDYGMMNGSKVLKYAQDLISE